MLRVAYVQPKMSERDILRKMAELQLQLILHLPLKKKEKKKSLRQP